MLGSISLSEIYSVEDYSGLQFQLNCGPRSYVLRAESAELKSQWIQKIRQRIASKLDTSLHQSQQTGEISLEGYLKKVCSLLLLKCTSLIQVDLDGRFVGSKYVYTKLAFTIIVLTR